MILDMFHHLSWLEIFLSQPLLQFAGKGAFLGSMNSHAASTPNLGKQPGVSVRKVLVVTVGMVPSGCGLVRGNRSEGCCGTSEMIVEAHQREVVLW